MLWFSTWIYVHLYSGGLVTYNLGGVSLFKYFLIQISCLELSTIHYSSKCTNTIHPIPLYCDSWWFVVKNIPNTVNLYSGGHAPIIWGAHHYLLNIFISKPFYNLLTMYYSLIHEYLSSYTRIHGCLWSKIAVLVISQKQFWAVSEFSAKLFS